MGVSGDSSPVRRPRKDRAKEKKRLNGEKTGV